MHTWGDVYSIDCSKIAAYAYNPEGAAQLLAKKIRVDDARGFGLGIGDTCLGTLDDVIVEGTVVKIYVRLHSEVSRGQYFGKGAAA